MQESTSWNIMLQISTLNLGFNTGVAVVEVSLRGLLADI
jgi:hypothetical protein